jgi:restriction system protein
MTGMVVQLPKHDGLFWPVVNALQVLGGSADNDQLVEKVSDLLGLADELTAIPHKAGPQTEISYRIAWVKTWLKWGEVVDNPQRAVWVLTEKGRSATEQQIEALRLELRSNSGNRRKNNASEATIQEQDLDLPKPEEILEFADDDWQTELLSVIKEMDPSAFERLVRVLLLRLGFSQVEVVGRSGDGGIDLLGVVKVNNVLSFRVLAQCKRYRDAVGPGDIRNFRGAMQGRTDKGIFVTSGRFTGEARKESSRDGVPEIDLVDGEALSLLLKDLKMGVETEMIERVSIRRSFFAGI